MSTKLFLDHQFHFLLISIDFVSIPPSVRLNGARTVTGILRGFDPFMNLVIDEAWEELKNGERVKMGMSVVRGNAVVLMESLDRI